MEIIQPAELAALTKNGSGKIAQVFSHRQGHLEKTWHLLVDNLLNTEILLAKAGELVSATMLSARSSQSFDVLNKLDVLLHGNGKLGDLRTDGIISRYAAITSRLEVLYPELYEEFKPYPALGLNDLVAQARSNPAIGLCALYGMVEISERMLVTYVGKTAYHLGLGESLAPLAELVSNADDSLTAGLLQAFKYESSELSKKSAASIINQILGNVSESFDIALHRESYAAA